MGVYTTQLDCVRTFLLKIHTAATTKHIDEAAKIQHIADTQRMFVNRPEMIGSDGDDFYWQRYKIEIEETSEANLTTALNNILIGIKKFNKRTAITGFVYASAPTMCHMKYYNSTEPKSVKKTGNWKCDLWMDVEWSTS